VARSSRSDVLKQLGRQEKEGRTIDPRPLPMSPQADQQQRKLACLFVRGEKKPFKFTVA
jgi:hypothetical protein